MPKHSKVVQKCPDELKQLVADPFLEPHFKTLLVTAKVELTTTEYERSFATLGKKRGGYPPIESLLEKSALQEPMLFEAFQAMIGKGYEYNAAASKMIETALLIVQINKRLQQRRVALLASAASERDGYHD
jgi:hypothetical protein